MGTAKIFEIEEYFPALQFWGKGWNCLVYPDTLVALGFIKFHLIKLCAVFRFRPDNKTQTAHIAALCTPPALAITSNPLTRKRYNQCLSLTSE